MRHGVKVEYRHEVLGDDRLVVHDRRHVHPCHCHNAENVLKISEINGYRGSEHCHSECENVLDKHNYGQSQQRKEVYARARNYYYRKNYNETQQHIDETARHIGYRYDHSRKVDFLDEVFLRDDRSRANGY